MPDDLPSSDDDVAENNARKRAARQVADDAAVVRELLASSKGRSWFMRKILEPCDMFGNAYREGSFDGTAYMLGRQSVGKSLWLEAESAAPDLITTMRQEYAAEIAAIESEREKRNDVIRVQNDPVARPVSEDDQYPVLSKPEAV